MKLKLQYIKWKSSLLKLEGKRGRGTPCKCIPYQYNSKHTVYGYFKGKTTNDSKFPYFYSSTNKFDWFQK